MCKGSPRSRAHCRISELNEAGGVNQKSFQFFNLDVFNFERLSSPQLLVSLFWKFTVRYFRLHVFTARAKIFLEKKAGIAILCSCSKWDNAKKLTTQLCALISSESRPTRDNPYPLLIILPFSECPTKYQDRLEKSSCSLGEITRSGCYYFSLKKGDLANDLLQETKTIPITFHFISFIFILGIFRHGLLHQCRSSVICPTCFIRRSTLNRGLKKPKNCKFVCFMVRGTSVRFLETVPFDPRGLGGLRFLLENVE